MGLYRGGGLAQRPRYRIQQFNICVDIPAHPQQISTDKLRSLNRYPAGPQTGLSAVGEFCTFESITWAATLGAVPMRQFHPTIMAQWKHQIRDGRYCLGVGDDQRPAIS